MEKRYEFILKNDPDEFLQLSNRLQKIAEENNIDKNASLQIEVCLDEIFTNIISYSYNDKHKHEIKIILDFNTRELQVKIIDDGEAFDPTNSKEPDLNANLEERPIGGLGLHMVKNIMDSISYKRKEGKNILILTKKI